MVATGIDQGGLVHGAVKSSPRVAVEPAASSAWKEGMERGTGVIPPVREGRSETSSRLPSFMGRGIRMMPDESSRMSHGWAGLASCLRASSSASWVGGT